jgi:hypothetical protein
VPESEVRPLAAIATRRLPVGFLDVLAATFVLGLIVPCAKPAANASSR